MPNKNAYHSNDMNVYAWAMYPEYWVHEKKFNTHAHKYTLIREKEKHIWTRRERVYKNNTVPKV